MSVAMMTLTFERFPRGGTAYIVALKCADYAHDDGTSIYPSVETLALYARSSVRQVRRVLRQLEEMGWLEVVEKSVGGRRSTVYRMQVENYDSTFPPLPKPGQNDRVTENNTRSKCPGSPVIAVSGQPGHSCVRGTIIEPSLNRHILDDGVAEWFEAAWKEYPKRAGANPKKLALRAYTARLKEGHKPERLIAGARRYAEFCKRTGKLGTEYVMQAATFYGPDEHFTNDWEPPARTNGGKPSKMQRTLDAFKH